VGSTRVLTRDSARASCFEPSHVEIAEGDVRDTRAVALRPVQPTLACQIQAGVLMDTRDMTWDCAEQAPLPVDRANHLAEMVKRDYLPRTQV
jgi:hypothetical protein